MSRVLAATWQARGMHGGLVVPHRRVSALQRWHVRVTIVRPAVEGVDARSVLSFDADQPCDLRTMHGVVMRELGDVLPDGAMVRDARLEFFVTPGGGR